MIRLNVKNQKRNNTETKYVPFSVQMACGILEVVHQGTGEQADTEEAKVCA